MKIDDCQVGQRVRICRPIERRAGAWHNAVTGVIRSIHTEKTGSWYAHGKHGKLWLRRVLVEKPDGESTLITIDPLTTIEPADEA
ncbi:MAG: hypothetical protein KKB50_05925 [Planctomycetes bacterium]|nr:hypothetical protein [Planctomycetota bacterium]